MKSSLLFFISGLLTFTACNSSDNSFDASGVFEAEEVVVAAEANGRIIAFLAEEGAVLEAGQVIGKIDDTALALQKQEIIARLEALQAKTGSAAPQVAVYQQQIVAQEDQIAVLQTQLDHLKIESKRFGQLVSAAAVPEKQLDDITAQIAVLEQQIHAATAQRGVLRQQIQSHQQQIALQNRSLLSEDAPLRAKLAQLEHQIAQCTITNPVSGTVISSFAEVGEYTGMGKALYKIANLHEMILRAYITGEQLSRIKINQSVRILAPGQETTGTPLTGQVTWISDKAEFTPKTIQTREERAHLVYATRIKVKNNGTLKIGMYADLLFD